MALIAAGTIAPPLRLDDAFGATFGLAAQLARTRVALAFYPADSTPG